MSIPRSKLRGGLLCLTFRLLRSRLTFPPMFRDHFTESEIAFRRKPYCCFAFPLVLTFIFISYVFHLISHPFDRSNYAWFDVLVCMYHDLFIREKKLRNFHVSRVIFTMCHTWFVTVIKTRVLAHILIFGM